MECLYCKLCGKCPIGGKPLPDYHMKNGLVDELKFTCENLVELYDIFRTIGIYRKEERMNEQKRSLEYFG